MSARLSPELRPGIRDVFVVLAVVLLAVGTAVLTWGADRSGGAVTAVFSVDGAESEPVSLEADFSRTVSANGYVLEVCCSGGEIWIESSDCPTQDCVHTGHISRSGQSIVCLPAHVIITLEGAADNSDSPDIVIG